MKYRSCYSVRFEKPVHDLVNELCFSIRDGEFKLQEVDSEGLNGKAIITIPIDPNKLSIRVGSIPLSGELPQRGLDVPEAKEVGSILMSAVRVLSFALEIPIHAARLLQDTTIIVESKADEERLKELESLKPFIEIGSRLSIRAPSLKKIDKMRSAHFSKEASCNLQRFSRTQRKAASLH